MITNMHQIDVLKEFKIIPRPAESELDSSKGRYARLMLALKHLNNEDSFELSLSYIKGANFKSWLNNIRQQAKKKYNIKVGGFVKNGNIILWSTRG